MATTDWIWADEGTGAFHSWNEVFELTRRANGTFILGVRRVGIEDSWTEVVFRSKPFRRPEHLFPELAAACHAAQREPFDEAEVLRLLSRVISVAPELAASALMVVSERLWNENRLRPRSSYW